MFALIRRASALNFLLAVAILIQTVWPTTGLALTSGPTQPETQQFIPVGTQDLVDPFTGNFSYNIPLFEIGGYPINLSYDSDQKMEDEASWGGFGWSLNPGAITRQMRGIPDDFKGENIIGTREKEKIKIVKKK